jgi:hypothetical protein
MNHSNHWRRRDLLSLAAVYWPAAALAQESGAAALPPLPEAAVRVMTPPPRHHFFGYYGIPPWNASQTRLVCLESDFQDRLPAQGEKARIGLVDAGKGGFEPLAETAAWNFQQGCMLFWRPLAADREILFNDRRERGFITVVMDVESGRQRELPRAIAAVGNRGQYGLCIDYGRQGRMRKVVGYAGAEDPYASQPAPKDDGVWRMDLRTGESKLLVSIAEVYERLRGHPLIDGRRHMFFQHAVFNKSDTRFFFLARVFTDPPRPELESAMFTAATDGSALREVIPFGRGVSHFEWRNDREIIATFRMEGSREKLHVLFHDGEGDYQVLGRGFLTSDGHCSASPGGEWMVTDQNVSSAMEKRLLLYHLPTGRGTVLARMPMKEPRYMGGDLRCDLHPRWNRTGTQICFDALEQRSWSRQLHVATLRPATSASASPGG